MYERIPVKNLSHLKKLLVKGACFRILSHSFRKESEGIIREVNVVQGNAVYAKIKNNPEHKYSVCNGGRGLRMDYEKASCYRFGDTVKVLRNPDDEASVIYEFEVIKS